MVPVLDLTLELAPPVVTEPVSMNARNLPVFTPSSFASSNNAVLFVNSVTLIVVFSTSAVAALVFLPVSSIVTTTVSPLRYATSLLRYISLTGVGVGVAVGVAVGVSVTVGVAVAVGVSVGVAVGV